MDRISVDRGREISCTSQPKFDTVFLCKLTKKSGESRMETSQSFLRGNIQNRIRKVICGTEFEWNRP